MIPFTTVIAALKAAGTPFKFVGGAIDLTVAGEHMKQFPAAYVLPLADGASPNDILASNAVSQMLTERFGVMYAIRNVTPGAGDKTQEDMRVAIDWARTALVGLVIDTTRDLVQFEGGDLQNFDDSIGIWFDRFSTWKNLRKV